MKLDDDDFRLLGLPQRFALDRDELDARWRALQSRVHPDRFAVEGTAAQRVAMQWAVRVNEAYRRLRDPLSRAAYLCELRGVAISAEDNTAMPVEFLMKQMSWREALDDANDIDDVEVLAGEVRSEQLHLLTEIGEALDERGDAVQAAGHVRALMFVERFDADVDRRLESLES